MSGSQIHCSQMDLPPTNVGIRPRNAPPADLTAEEKVKWYERELEAVQASEADQDLANQLLALGNDWTPWPSKPVGHVFPVNHDNKGTGALPGSVCYSCGMSQAECLVVECKYKHLQPEKMRHDKPNNNAAWFARQQQFKPPNQKAGHH